VLFVDHYPDAVRIGQRPGIFVKNWWLGLFVVIRLSGVGLLLIRRRRLFLIICQQFKSYQG
jgi:hypothetical protein